MAPLDRFFLKKGSVAKYPDQPDLTDQVRASLDMLSKKRQGIRADGGGPAAIDKYSHSLDWEARGLRHHHARQRP